MASKSKIYKFSNFKKDNNFKKNSDLNANAKLAKTSNIARGSDIGNSINLKNTPQCANAKSSTAHTFFTAKEQNDLLALTRLCDDENPLVTNALNELVIGFGNRSQAALTFISENLPDDNPHFLKSVAKRLAPARRNTLVQNLDEKFAAIVNEKKSFKRLALMEISLEQIGSYFTGDIDLNGRNLSSSLAKIAAELRSELRWHTQKRIEDFSPNEFARIPPYLAQRLFFSTQFHKQNLPLVRELNFTRTITDGGMSVMLLCICLQLLAARLRSRIALCNFPRYCMAAFMDRGKEIKYIDCANNGYVMRADDIARNTPHLAPEINKFLRSYLDELGTLSKYFQNLLSLRGGDSEDRRMLYQLDALAHAAKKTPSKSQKSNKS